MERKILEWIATGDTGLSSKAMAFAAVGIESRNNHPCDPSDFNRCLMLIDQVPEVKNCVNEIAAMSDTWQKLMERWDELEQCFIDECGFNWSKKGKRAVKTYELMKEIGC